MLLSILAAPFLIALAVDPIRWSSPSTNRMRELNSFLEPLRKRLELPALAVAVVQRGQIESAGAVGERKLGSGISVTLADKFHIGSCTKSLTALLAVNLVREGKIRFETRIRDVFPDWPIDEKKKEISLESLLQHRSGIPGEPTDGTWSQAWQFTGSPVEQRKEFLRAVLREPLEAPPGTKYIYSNSGFALAGAMLEQSAGRPWEDLMRDHIFGPLALKSAGFGPPSSEHEVDAPWGHQWVDGKIRPIPPSDNPVAIAPAARVHMSILDLARYAAFQMDNFNRRIPELKEYRDKMYTPPPGSAYAFGWLVPKRKWAGGTALTHAGSNTMFYAVIWIAPARDFAFVLATNIGDADGENRITESCDRIIAALIKKYLP